MGLPLFPIFATAVLSLGVLLILRFAVMGSLEIYGIVEEVIDVVFVVLFVACVLIILACFYMGIWSGVGEKPK